jgi:DNA-directed RNA polymerase specialized sigma24 family protein
MRADCRMNHDSSVSDMLVHVESTESTQVSGAAIVGPNQDWEPNEKSFQDFLNWLDGGANSDGQRYLEVRQRLELYFDRKNCVAPSQLADETLNRVIRKLQENGEVKGVAPLQYCYMVAKYVFLEALRADNRSPFYRPVTTANPTNLSGQSVSVQDTNAASEQKQKVTSCVESLSSTDRELIVEYYRGQQRNKTERRAALAARLGLTANALSTRACGVRQRLEVCIEACLKKG